MGNHYDPQDEENERKEESNSEAIERKQEWKSHECTSKLIKDLEARRRSTLTNLISHSKSSEDPVIREYGCRLAELDHLIELTGLKGLV